MRAAWPSRQLYFVPHGAHCRLLTADTALRLARFLKTSPQLWMRLQADWDLYQAMQREARKAS